MDKHINLIVLTGTTGTYTMGQVLEVMQRLSATHTEPYITLSTLTYHGTYDGVDYMIHTDMPIVMYTRDIENHILGKKQVDYIGDGIYSCILGNTEYYIKYLDLLECL